MVKNIGNYIGSLGIKFQNTNNLEKNLEKNIKSFISFIKKNKDIKLLFFDKDTPFFNEKTDPVFLGKNESLLKELGQVLKIQRVRVCTVINDLNFGLANTDQIGKIRDTLTLHAQFYDLCRLDCSSMIFIPYGDVYLCDYEKFRKEFSRLPSYISNRIGILDRNNISSMVVANNQKLPWIFNLDSNDHNVSQFLEKSILSFKEFGLMQNIKPIFISQNLPKDFEYNEIDVLVLNSGYKVKNGNKKIRVRSTHKGISSKNIRQSRKTKDTSASLCSSI